MSTTVTLHLSPSGALKTDVVDIEKAFDAVSAALSDKNPRLIMLRDQGRILTYITYTETRKARRNDHSSHIIDAISRAASASVTRLEDDEKLTLSAQGTHVLVSSRRPDFSQETLAGAQPFAIASHVATALSEDGQWIAVAWRRKHRFEKRRWERYYSFHRPDKVSHPSTKGSSVAATISAGGGATDDVAHVLDQARVQFMGFDESTTLRNISLARTALLASLLAAAAALGAVAAMYIIGVFTHPWLPLASWKIASVVIVSAMLLAATPFVIHRGIPHRSMPVMPARVKWRKPKDLVSRKNTKDGSKIVTKRTVRRPLRRDVFIVAPTSFMGLLSTHSEAGLGVTVTATRPAPREVVEATGLAFGLDRAGARVHIPSDGMFEGVGFTGKPGTGKTHAQAAHFAWYLLRRRHGENHPQLFLDTKGETTELLRAWCEGLGISYHVVHMAERAVGVETMSPTLDLLHHEGTAEERGRWIADLLKHALDDGDVRARSMESLTAIFTAACAVTPVILREAEKFCRSQYSIPVIGPKMLRTIPQFAHIMMGGQYGEEPGRSLYAAFRSAASAPEENVRPGAPCQTCGARVSTPTCSHDNAVLAARFLGLIWGSDVTKSARESLITAARNKVDAMLTAPAVWWKYRPAKQSTPKGPIRQSLSWNEILTNKDVVIVNLGVDEAGHTLPTGTVDFLASLSFTSLRQEIMKTCSGWRSQGNKVVFMCDELATLKAASEIFSWMRQQGRSYGIELSLACQSPNQLNEEMRSSFLGFATIIGFSSNDADYCAEMAKRMSITKTVWDPSDFATLVAYSAIVSTAVNGQIMTPFTAKLADLSGNIKEFADIQEGRALMKGEVPA